MIAAGRQVEHIVDGVLDACRIANGLRWPNGSRRKQGPPGSGLADRVRDLDLALVAKAWGLTTFLATSASA